MGNILGYFQGPRYDSEKQLQDARKAAGNYSSEADKQAQAAGFKSANEMALWMKAKQKGASTTSRTSSLPSLADLFSWHPSNTIQRASDALESSRK